MTSKTFVAAFLISIISAFASSDDQQQFLGPIDRIYRGWHLTPHEFPFMVKLKVRAFSCILCNNYILTLLSSRAFWDQKAREQSKNNTLRVEL